MHLGSSNPLKGVTPFRGWKDGSFSNLTPQHTGWLILEVLGDLEGFWGLRHLRNLQKDFQICVLESHLFLRFAQVLPISVIHFEMQPSTIQSCRL